jgi:translation factor GUF1, mitochondrial
VISLISVQEGVVRKGDRIVSCHTGKKYEIVDVGIMNPEEVSTGSLYPGQVGYIACNMKESSEGKCTFPVYGLELVLTLSWRDKAHIGDTLYRVGSPVKAMPGFKPTKAMVFAGVFPIDTNDFVKLEGAYSIFPSVEIDTDYLHSC